MIILLLAVLFNTLGGLGYFGRFALILLIIVISATLTRRLRCPKCNQPIGEGPIAGVTGSHCPLPPKQHCRFCGERLE